MTHSAATPGTDRPFPRLGDQSGAKSSYRAMSPLFVADIAHPSPSAMDPSGVCFVYVDVDSFLEGTRSECKLSEALTAENDEATEKGLQQFSKAIATYQCDDDPNSVFKLDHECRRIAKKQSLLAHQIQLKGDSYLKKSTELYTQAIATECEIKNKTTSDSARLNLNYKLLFHTQMDLGDEESKRSHHENAIASYSDAVQTALKITYDSPTDRYENISAALGNLSNAQRMLAMEKLNAKKYDEASDLFRAIQRSSQQMIDGAAAMVDLCNKKLAQPSQTLRLS